MSLRKSISILLATACLATSHPLLAEDAPAAPKKPWKNVAEFSLVSTNGNSDSSSISGKDTFNYDWTKFGFELIGGGLGSKSDGVQTAERYYASEKGIYKLATPNYLYEKYAWDKDRFAGIRNRHDFTVGLGRELVKTPLDLLIGEFGLGRVVEEHVDAKTNSFITARLYSKYTRKLSETGTFTQDAEYLHNFEDSANFRVNAETALMSSLSKHLSLKLSYLWKYVGVPPDGFGHNDTTTTVALVATY